MSVTLERAEVRARTAAGTDVALLRPFVSWQPIALASDPTAWPKRSRLKTLRHKDVLSDGIRVAAHTGHGVAGSAHWYSTLNVVAVILSRRGNSSEAAAVAARAGRLEARIARGDLSQLDFRADLARLLHAEALEAFSRLNIRIEEVEFAAVRGGEAILEDGDGNAWHVPIDSPVLAGSTFGDPLFVVTEVAPAGNELTYYLPGLHVEQEASEPLPDDLVSAQTLPDSAEARAFFAALLPGRSNEPGQ